MESGFRPSNPALCVDGFGRINQYALVAYIDGKLGDFLFHLRQEIVPTCKLRSHVSLLPPRPLQGTEADATQFLQDCARHQSAFQVTLGAIEVFPVTNVVYIAIADGLVNLQNTHSKMNASALQYAEPYPFHPHITLAQEISETEHAAVHQHCLARWNEYTGPRHFPVEVLTFVQNTSNAGWIDLSEARLEMAGSRR
jgi:2'-5' RNA ligase